MNKRNQHYYWWCRSRLFAISSIVVLLMGLIINLPVSAAPKIIVDHTALDTIKFNSQGEPYIFRPGLFNQIPSRYIMLARGMKMLFVDRSVGQNISDGLNCLEHNFINQPLSVCKRDLTAQSYTVFGVPDNRDNYYLRSNWRYEFSNANLWNEITQDFFQVRVANAVSDQVVSFQFNYLATLEGSHIMDRPTTNPPYANFSPGFFYPDPDNNSRWDISDYEQYERDNPDKTIIYWTASINKQPTKISNDFNQAMRQYTSLHNKVLFDYADIMSHDIDGTECRYNGYERICDRYSTETVSGHISTAIGYHRIAKAVWILMARISGWNPEVATTPTMTTAPTLTATIIPTTEMTTVPTTVINPTQPSTCSEKHKGDANCNGLVNSEDYAIFRCEFLNNGSCIGQGNASVNSADFNNDQRVDLRDFEIWRQSLN